MCHVHIPKRLFIVEVVTGMLFVLVVITAQSISDVFIGSLIVAMAVVITIYDMRHLVIPDVFVYSMSAIAVLGLLIDFWPAIITTTTLGYVVSGLCASLFYGSLWVISNGRWLGLGDVKLALPLGIMLSASETFSFVVLSFWVGAAISLLLLLTQWISKRGQVYLRFLDIPLTMKSEVPFAPFLLIAFALVYFFHIDVFSLFTVTL